MTAEDRERIRAQAPHADTYQFFDLIFCIRSDAPEILATFRHIFSRFLIQPGKAAGRSYYILEKDRPSGAPRVMIEDKIYTMDHRDDIIGYAYMKLMESALSGIKSHFLFHAAALSSKGRGLILPAASKSGKTTLSLTLAGRGFDFFSDDVAAVSVPGHMLHPFPKGLGILPSTLELCPEAELDSLKSLPLIGGGEKKLLDIGDLYPGKIGRPCPVKYLVFLGKEPAAEKASKIRENLFIVINKYSDDLIQEIGKIEGIEDVRIHPYKKYPILKLALKGRGFLRFQLEAACRKHDVLIYDSSDGREEKADFTQTPVLEKMTTSAAALKLLKELKGGFRAAVLHDVCGGNITKLYMKIIDFLGPVQCYVLTPGGLEARADRICELMG
jgi:hypothetical protein